MCRKVYIDEEPINYEHKFEEINKREEDYKKRK